MRFETADGAPTLLAYVLIAAATCSVAVTVLLVTWERTRRQQRRNTRAIEGLKCVVHDIRGYFRAEPEPSDELSRRRAAKRKASAG